MVPTADAAAVVGQCTLLSNVAITLFFTFCLFRGVDFVCATAAALAAAECPDELCVYIWLKAASLEGLDLQLLVA